MKIPLTPHAVEALTPWEFTMVMQGHNEANAGEAATPPTPDEHDEMVAKYG